MSSKPALNKQSTSAGGGAKGPGGAAAKSQIVQSKGGADQKLSGVKGQQAAKTTGAKNLQNAGKKGKGNKKKKKVDNSDEVE